MHPVDSVVKGDLRYRVIWNTIYWRPRKETFHEFIIHALTWTYGEDWRVEQARLPPEERHVVLRWVDSFGTWKARNSTNENLEADGQTWATKPSGTTQALLSLAYDTFCLQTVNRLPAFMVDRLKNREEFQGARYEVAVAAIFARAGYGITFLDEIQKKDKHCEFVARHQVSGEEVSVEAKSRHRKGVLHENGSYGEPGHEESSYTRLIRHASEQRSEHVPFVVFLDLNRPQTPRCPLESKPWYPAVTRLLRSRRTPSASAPDSITALVFTNFSYYYSGDDPCPSTNEYCLVLSLYPERPLLNTAALAALDRGLQTYSVVPKEV